MNVLRAPAQVLGLFQKGAGPYVTFPSQSGDRGPCEHTPQQLCALWLFWTTSLFVLGQQDFRFSR